VWQIYTEARACLSDPAEEEAKMNHPKTDNLRTALSSITSITCRRRLLMVLLAGALAALFIAGQAPLAQADVGAKHGHTFVVTFTKWITSEPADPPSVAGVSMAGVVGGDVGAGRYAGVVLDDDLSVPGFWLGHARYEFHGRKHTFIADVHVVENDTTDPATAKITGVVTTGWLKGAKVTGEYTVLPNCPIATPGNVFDNLCFQGSLQIQPGHGSDK
jgi:hypothetical protein